MEHYYECFFAYIEAFIILPDEAKKRIRQTFKPIFVPKETIIAPAGEVPRLHNFVVSGYLRSFHVDDNGNESTVDLNNGPRFFTSYESFLYQVVSNENIHCITDCELLQINFEDFQKTLQESEASRAFTIKLFEKLLLEAKQKRWEMANLNAEKRYQKFAKENHTVLQNVPLGYIASYLGITQRHLSRLRKG
jgi:CRP/FNR family transcriptional regulator, anaerobic regulatory protein